MSTCPEQTFDGITAEKWQILKAKATENGIALNSDTGQASQQGFTFSWKYDAASATLTIQCLDRPFWVPCGLIESKVQDIVSRSLA